MTTVILGGHLWRHKSFHHCEVESTSATLGVQEVDYQIWWPLWQTVERKWLLGLGQKRFCNFHMKSFRIHMLDRAGHKVSRLITKRSTSSENALRMPKLIIWGERGGGLMSPRRGTEGRCLWSLPPSDHNCVRDSRKNCPAEPINIKNYTW